MTTVEEPPPVQDEQPAAKHTLSRMDGSGDTKIEWDPDNEPEVDAARAMFEELKKKKYLAYRTDDNGNQAEVIHDFDPEAASIIMSPQLVGG